MRMMKFLIELHETLSISYERCYVIHLAIVRPLYFTDPSSTSHPTLHSNVIENSRIYNAIKR